MKDHNDLLATYTNLTTYLSLVSFTFTAESYSRRDN